MKERIKAILEEDKGTINDDGNKFYAECDFKFAYSRGKCSEIKDEKVKMASQRKGG